jgi:hypothetical protein
MALGPEVIDLVRLNVVNKVVYLAGIGQITVMKEEGRVGRVRINVNVVDTVRVECAGTPDDPVDLVTLAQ